MSYHVDLPSGRTFEVMTLNEADEAEKLIKGYMDTFEFPNPSDLEDLSKIVCNELLIHRWNVWLSSGKDYNGRNADTRDLTKWKNEASTETRLLKKSLGIDKSTRDKTQGEDSVSQYLINLRDRAEQMGIHRDNQTARAIELINEVIALQEFHDNCSPDERKRFSCTPEDIVTWIRETLSPEFKTIDKHFRETNQKMWIQTQ